MLDAFYINAIITPTLRLFNRLSLSARLSLTRLWRGIISVSPGCARFKCPSATHENNLLYDQNISLYFLFSLLVHNKKVKIDDRGSIKKGGKQTFFTQCSQSAATFSFPIKEAVKGITSIFRWMGEMRFFNITALLGRRVVWDGESIFGSYLGSKARAGIMGNNLRGPDGPSQNIHCLIEFLSQIPGQVLDRNVLN